MKVLSLVLSAIVFVAVVAQEMPHPTFEQFKTSFSKKYSSDQEHKFREMVYQSNLKKIQAINSNPKYTWKAAVNRFADLLPSELKSLYGLNRNMKFFNYKKTASTAPSKDFLHNLPESVDWSQQGFVAPVRDQGACGSCWAFSAVSVLESHIAIQSGQLYYFSEQQLIDCAENPQHCGGTGGCEGSTQEIAFAYAQANGIISRNDYPYKGRDLKCAAGPKLRMATIEGFVKLPENDYNALMTALATTGPVAISVAATEWEFYSRGVYNGDCGTEINHAVTAVGYGVDPKFGPYWLVRNSWSQSWGEDGYIRIAREASAADVKCGIDYNPSAGSACDGGPEQITVCGLCGILSDSSHPYGGKLL
jgi:cathepsin L